MGLALAVAGCPSSDPVFVDAGARDAARPRDAGRDAAVVCDTGEHRCGGGCIPDLSNDPAMGCRLGCGEACIAPTNGTATCTGAGTCDFTCNSPFRRVGDACMCTPSTCEDLGFMECGMPDDGCGTPLDCGSCDGGRTCERGLCACPADAHEENDSRSTATVIPGDLDDSTDPDTSVNDFSIHVMRDVDWIRWHVIDGFDLGGNPVITVTLDMLPIGADYDMSAYFVCDSGGDASSCEVGTSDNMVGRGCRSANVGAGITESVRIATECSGIDEHGFLYVRVDPRTLAACGDYRVTLNVR
jgi:hypothetical protein